MKRSIYLALTFMIITGFASATFGNGPSQPVIIDVRTTLEWDLGHLEGAILIPYGQIGEKIGAIVPDKSQKIYVYCRTGHRAQIAKDTLEKMGYKDVVNLGSLKNAANVLKIKIVQ